MKTTTYQEQYANRFFRYMLVLIFLLLSIYTSMAQVRTRFSNLKYKGFEASFGTHSFRVNSDINKINGMHAGHEGGSLGVVVGNERIISRFTLGYFSSNSNTPHTQEIFEGAIRTNVYPLGFLKKQSRIRPYLTVGLGMDNIKFYGYYVDQGNTTMGAYEPLLGKVQQISFTGGAGLGYSLSKYNDFISVFAEMNTVMPLNVSASTPAFNQTTLSQFSSFSVGVRFGLNSKS